MSYPSINYKSSMMMSDAHAHLQPVNASQVNKCRVNHNHNLLRNKPNYDPLVRCPPNPEKVHHRIEEEEVGNIFHGVIEQEQFPVASGDVLERNMWYCGAPESEVIHGPFSTIQMSQEYPKLLANVLIKRECDKRFVTLADMAILYGGNPFKIGCDRLPLPALPLIVKPGEELGINPPPKEHPQDFKEVDEEVPASSASVFRRPCEDTVNGENELLYDKAEMDPVDASSEIENRAASTRTARESYEVPTCSTGTGDAIEGFGDTIVAPIRIPDLITLCDSDDTEIEVLSHKAPQRKYRCSKCNFSTDVKEYFLFHRKKYHREKVLACEMCKKMFMSRGGLHLHRKNQHPQPVFTTNKGYSESKQEKARSRRRRQI